MKEIDDIHRPFIAWLTERQIPYIYHRGDRKSGIHSGHPDFTILWMRRQIMIECKTPGGRLSDLQVKRINFLRRNGNVVEIARTVSECIEAVQSILCTGEKPSQLGVCNYPLEGCFKALREAVESAGTPGAVLHAEIMEEVKFGTPHLDCIGAEDKCKTSTQNVPVNGSDEHLFIGYLGNTAKVFQGSGKSGDLATMVRTATPTDLATLPRG